MANKKLGKDTYIYWYKSMILQRRFEEKAAQLYGQQKIRGFCHLYMGQEAVSSGMMTAIQEQDNVITAYRDHGMALAKGLDPKPAMAELFGKATGCSHGKGGSMHFFSKEHRFFGGHGIVGAQIAIGAGIAFAEQYKGSDSVTLCFFGDGAARQGILHETLNMATLWNLPVVFICENNHYAMGTSVERTSKVVDIYQLANTYGIDAESMNGMDPVSVHNAIHKAVENARKGNGPSFLEAKTYRYLGHSLSDPANYRTKKEVEEYKQKDPITEVINILKDKKWASEKEIEQWDEEAKARVAEAIKFADESPFPDSSELYSDMYAENDYPFIMD